MMSSSMPWKEPEIKPVSGHPRLFLRKEHIEHLKENMRTSELCEIAERIRGYADETMEITGDPGAAVEKILESRALMYLIGEKDKAHARQTVKYAREYIEKYYVNERPDNENAPDATRIVGNAMIACAIVYDWCYDCVDDDDKKVFVDNFKRIAKMKEIGYPPVNPNLSSLASHGSELEIFRDMIGVGIAIYDEDTEMYNLAAGRFFAEMAEPRKYYNKSGNHPMGNSYGYYRFGCELWAQIIFDRMGYPDVLGGDMHRVAYKWLYERLPYGQRFRDGDDFSHSKNRLNAYPTEDLREVVMMANYFKDPYLRREALKCLSLADYGREEFWVLLFSEPSVGIKNTNELPLARKTVFPFTSLLARTSWQAGRDAPTAMAHMKIQEKFLACHMHLDSGGFQIYYKGNLASVSGIYQGNDGGSGCSHYANYYTRTIAHNCVTVTDPEEKLLYSHGQGTDFSNDGGQRRGMTAPFAVSFEKQVLQDTRAEAEGIYTGPDEYTPKFSYVKGNIGFGYGEKVKEYRRAMVFTDLFDKDFPAAFVVYDRVTAADKSFKKRWLLHSVEEPELSGNTVTIRRTENGFNGKLVNKTILPENPQLTAVGGKGKEYTVEGINFPNGDYVGAQTEGAAWRTEISPGEENETDTFLNAMYVTDADNAAVPPEICALKTEKMMGVRIRDRIIMFSENLHRIDTVSKIRIPDSGFEKMSVLLTDMAPGVWSINGKIFAEVKADEGVLYFDAEPGEYTLIPNCGEKPMPVPCERVNKQCSGDFEVYFDGEFCYQPHPAKEISGRAYLPAKYFAERFGAGVETVCAGIVITNSRKEKMTVTENAVGVYGKKYDNKTAVCAGELYIDFSEFEEFFGIITKYDTVAKVYKVSKIDKEIYGLIKNESVLVPFDVRASGCEEKNPPRYAVDYTAEAQWIADGEQNWISIDLGDELRFSKILLSGSAKDGKPLKFAVEISATDGCVYRRVFEGEVNNAVRIFETGVQEARFIKLAAESGKVAVRNFMILK